MAVYLARSCPKCRNYFGVVIAETELREKNSKRIHGQCAKCDTKSTGRFFQGMARSAIDKIPPGPELDALTAEKVFGWKNIHKDEKNMLGKGG